MPNTRHISYENNDTKHPTQRITKEIVLLFFLISIRNEGLCMFSYIKGRHAFINALLNIVVSEVMRVAKEYRPTTETVNSISVTFLSVGNHIAVIIIPGISGMA